MMVRGDVVVRAVRVVGVGRMVRAGSVRPKKGSAGRGRVPVVVMAVRLGVTMVHNATMVRLGAEMVRPDEGMVRHGAEMVRLHTPGTAHRKMRPRRSVAAAAGSVGQVVAGAPTVRRADGQRGASGFSKKPGTGLATCQSR